MVSFKRILLYLSCVSVCAVIMSGCSKDDTGIVPGLQIVNVRCGIDFKNNNFSDPSKKIYKGYIYYKDFNGIYCKFNAFSSLSITGEVTTMMDPSEAPAKAAIWMVPEVSSSFTPDSSVIYNPDLVVTVVVLADISDGRTIDKKIKMHFSGPLQGDKLISNYLETLSCRINIEAKILDNGEPDIIIEAIPANEI